MAAGVPRLTPVVLVQDAALDDKTVAWLLERSLAERQREEEEAVEAAVLAELEEKVAVAEGRLLVELQREREDGTRISRQTWATLSRVEQLAMCFFPYRQVQDARHHVRYDSGEQVPRGVPKNWVLLGDEVICFRILLFVQVDTYLCQPAEAWFLVQNCTKLRKIRSCSSSMVVDFSVVVQIPMVLTVQADHRASPIAVHTVVDVPVALVVQNSHDPDSSSEHRYFPVAPYLQVVRVPRVPSWRGQLCCHSCTF